MSKFSANIFLIQITSNYFWASEVCKNPSSKNSFIFEPKVEKKDMDVFSTQFVLLILILATKILAE